MRKKMPGARFTVSQAKKKRKAVAQKTQRHGEHKNKENQRAPADGSGEVAVFTSRCQVWVVSPEA
jgi:hypothetical protein